MEFKFYNKKKIKLNVKNCNSIFSKFCGLMFKKQSLPLLFNFSREKIINIHSLFCKPFIAVWLDKNKKITKIATIKPWNFSISGRGMYLLEILENNSSYYKIMKTLQIPDGERFK